MNWKKFSFHLCAVYLGLLLLIALFAPWITRYSYEQQTILDRLQGPSLNHWMGTDLLGRDLFSRIIYGARMSLAVAASTAIFALLIGTTLGAIAGYWGGWIDSLLMRLIDIIYIFPSALLAILLSLLFGRGFLGILIALSLTSWVSHARLVRGLLLQTRELAYVEAARALGNTSFQILRKHIIPNIMGTIIASLTLQIPINMMTESFLSFIGLGLQPPFSSWGTLANEGFRAMQSYPHLMIFPSIVLCSTLFALTRVGDRIAENYS